MRKKEAISQQLEQILEELNSAKKESAATATVGHRRKALNPSWALSKLFFRFWGVRLILLLLVVAVLGVGSYLLFSGSTFKKESTPFVEHVQELATLATAKAHIKVVIEQEDNKLFGKDIKWDIPGTKQQLLLIVPATVIAGVDLNQFSSEDMKVDEENKVLEMTIPRATFTQDPAIQMDMVRTFSEEGLFRGEIKWEEGFDLAAEAQDLIQEEAVAIGLLETAEENAEKVIGEFFNNLGYTVQLSFK